jgi:hypothetical protein
MMFPSSIHLPANNKISLFFVAEYNTIVYKYHIFLIYSSVVGHFGCFHSLVIVNSASLNMGDRCFCFNLTYILLAISLGVVLLDYMAGLLLGFFFLFCDTGARTQGLHFESLHQPFFVMDFVERVSPTICQADFELQSF